MQGAGTSKRLFANYYCLEVHLRDNIGVFIRFSSANRFVEPFQVPVQLLIHERTAVDQSVNLGFVRGSVLRYEVLIGPMGDEARGTHHWPVEFTDRCPQLVSLTHHDSVTATSYTTPARMHGAVDANGDPWMLSADHHAAAYAAWTAITHQGCQLRRRAVHLGVRWTHRPDILQRLKTML